MAGVEEIVCETSLTFDVQEHMDLGEKLFYS